MGVQKVAKEKQIRSRVGQTEISDQGRIISMFVESESSYEPACQLTCGVFPHILLFDLFVFLATIRNLVIGLRSIKTINQNYDCFHWSSQ